MNKIPFGENPLFLFLLPKYFSCVHVATGLSGPTVSLKTRSETVQLPMPPDLVATTMSPFPSLAPPGQSAVSLFSDFHSTVMRQSHPGNKIDILANVESNVTPPRHVLT